MAVRADCRLPDMKADLGMPPHCTTLEEFWTQDLAARKKVAEVNEVRDDHTVPFATDLEIDSLFGSLDGWPVGDAPQGLTDLFAHEQLELLDHPPVFEAGIDLPDDQDPFGVADIATLCDAVDASQPS